ncbi:MAG TPA: xanthine dehydrogenase family protein molybdopterin-binding subunit [Solirubrobacteraceae bacterium]|nr:xanthine dehydrogenase family protein molybdopterin-binding subunit [Solirubrobacteraceae bacterium]
MTVQERAALAEIGVSRPRKDAHEKLSGQAQYVGDMEVAGMLHGKVLRSPFAHAAIRSIDISAAVAMEGVAAVLTASDLDDIEPYYGHAIKDRPIIAIDRVRFAGEPIAAVAAVSEAAAEAAVRAIAVEYDELPVLGTLEQALAADAPKLHDRVPKVGLFHGLGDLGEQEGNVCYRYALRSGDVEAARERAAITVEGSYTFPAVYQYAMETHATIAHYHGDGVTLWANCQHPFLVQAEIADLFGLPIGSVRIIVGYLGGGFGSKSYTKLEPLTVALARKAGRPVRIVNRVEESMVTSRRHGMRCFMRTTAAADGTLLTREARFEMDTGAYADNGPRVTATAGDAAPGPYRFEAVEVDASCVYCNTAPSGSYRAFGATHLQWIGESQIEEVARRAGLDPVELRRRSLVLPGEPVRPDGSGKPLDADLVGDIERASGAVGWDEPKPPWVGRGVSVGLLAAGAHPVSRASVRLTSDGTADVYVGTTELGQGARTVMSQIAAEELGLSSDLVRVHGADTRFTPYDRSTGASRSTTVAGLAVKRAAENVAARLRETAGELWDVEPAVIELAHGRAAFAGEDVSFPDLIAKRFGFRGGEIIEGGEVRPEGGDTGSYAEGPHFWEVCVAGAEVEVDPDTGVITVLRTATVADVGRAINPQLVERQDEGATLQGIGNALFEELIFEDGVVMNDNLLEYRVPRVGDMPRRMRTIIVENADGPGPYGAKGCGEGALAAVPAAIVCALADAGVAMNELPLTPERVWRRIHEQDPPAGAEPNEERPT